MKTTLQQLKHAIKYYRINWLYMMALAASIFVSSVYINNIALGQQLATYRDWHSSLYNEDKVNGKACNVWTQPTREEGKYTRRGHVYAFVTHWPKLERWNEFSLQMGYPVKEGATVKAKIGNKTFSLLSAGQNVYAKDTDNKRILQALKKGTKMIVEGVSSRGTKTKDTYSLLGLTKALARINKECNR